MGCPNCNSPCYYRNPMPSAKKGQEYEYSFAKCLGTIEREGWSTTKSGEKKYRRKYSKEPCGWTDGILSTPDLSDAGDKVADTPQKHTPDNTDNRVFLIDFHCG